MSTLKGWELISLQRKLSGVQGGGGPPFGGFMAVTKSEAIFPTTGTSNSFFADLKRVCWSFQNCQKNVAYGTPSKASHDTIGVSSSKKPVMFFDPYARIRIYLLIDKV